MDERSNKFRANKFRMRNLEEQYINVRNIKRYPEYAISI